MENADFAIHAEGFATVWLIEPVSQAAKEFVLEQLDIEEWQWAGVGFAVDHRAARDLCQALTDEGFSVMHPKYGQWRSR